MTEAEKKAKELVDRFYPYDSIQPETVHVFNKAKENALICVDEIVKSQYLNRKTTNKFWQEVKQAIEKL